MKKIIASLVLAACTLVHADTRENITFVIPAGANQSFNPLILKILDRANDQQTRYQFTPEFKPGANGSLGLKHMDASPQNRVAIATPAFVENVRSGLVNESDYVPIHALGDICMAVITNIGDGAQGTASLASLRGTEISVGGVGFGNVTHITSLLLGEKYGIRVKYVVFKSNLDAVVNMVGNNGINMALEPISTYHQFRERQPRLQMLGYNCAVRNEQAPELKTLREQGIDAPTIFNVTMANRAMPEEKRREIGRILDDATRSIGAREFAERAGIFPPVFRNISADEFARRRINLQRDMVKKFDREIESSK